MCNLSLAGQITPETYDGMRYYVTFIGHFSHFTHVYLMNHKNEVLEKFKQYEALMSAKHGPKKKSDDVTMVENTLAVSSRISVTTKVVTAVCYTEARNPEQNGVSERYNRTIMNMARCLLMDSNQPKLQSGEMCGIYN